MHTARGVVEFIGLEEWTPTLIQKQLGYETAEQLHYCAADLKKIGFADAAVVVHRDQGRRYTVITVVEPKYAADVNYRAHPDRNISIPKSWDKLRQVVDDPAYLEGEVLDYAGTLRGARTAQAPLADGTQQDWWLGLRRHTEAADYKYARKILSQAANPTDRSIAAMVLMNFADSDGAWHSLVTCLRDPEIRVAATCLQALNSLTTYLPRMIRWAPVVPDIAHLLRGTNLFALRILLKVLTVTDIDRALARRLLSGRGSHLVLAYFRAAHHDEHELAHNFLVQLHGSDLGKEPAAWETWILSLQRDCKKPYSGVRIRRRSRPRSPELLPSEAWLLT